MTIEYIKLKEICIFPNLIWLFLKKNKFKYFTNSSLIFRIHYLVQFYFCLKIMRSNSEYVAICLPLLPKPLLIVIDRSHQPMQTDCRHCKLLPQFLGTSHYGGKLITKSVEISQICWVSKGAAPPGGV